MQTLETIRQIYDYNIWANHEFPLYFQRIPQPDEKAVRVFAHLPLAEKTWLERRGGKNSDNAGKDFWASETVANCAAFFEENEQKFAEYFVCPNCGGDFVPRPIRPANRLAKYPASLERIFKPEGCAAAV